MARAVSRDLFALKGLTNKRDIRVSTANGRMVLSVTEDELVRVNMGEPNFEPAQVPFFAPTKRKRRILCERRNRPYCAAWFQWAIRTVLFRLITSTRRPLKTLGPVLESQ
ncbi:diaminopimelate epimerase [Salmonella enterica subsp. enterica]|uniref:Diaminopimelate epimerase n=1 Tax=Salmonella enterica I TaxID=59201 RepID=A0A447TRH0_SALET|nr:diaminopimelate epimerase [Salmonella enterica subsp. enterica]